MAAALFWALERVGLPITYALAGEALWSIRWAWGGWIALVALGAFLPRTEAEGDRSSYPDQRAVAQMAHIRVWRLALLALGAVLTLWGVWNGGMRDVLVKAINICTECIGLG